MKRAKPLPLVSTIRERCRVCYTCVRECPAKAIRISGGQAEVIAERCIGCGNCVTICSQQAKHVVSSIDEARELLHSGARVAACLAPAFPAEFTDLGERQLVGMLRQLGFDIVTEVAFGADLVAAAYRRLLADPTAGDRHIGTTCPAIASYVERLHPDLVPYLAPIVSPMIAMARVLRKLHGPDLKVVFIGPCLAKKAEAAADSLQGDIDAALTFSELRLMLDEEGISPRMSVPSDFDPPRSGLGALFPISRGLLQAAGISEDLILGDVVSADGRIGFQEAIREFERGHVNVRLLEVLCCNGCIMGPGMSVDTPLFSRRARVSDYVRRRAATGDLDQAAEDLAAFADLDLVRAFKADDMRLTPPSDEEIQEILERIGKASPADELNCGACGYDTCREHALAIYKGLAESEMCLPYTIEQLRRAVKELALSNTQLANTQEALVHSEKLASMGQLAAGIAHEVNNPLGVVLMYTHLLLEEAEADSPFRQELQTIVEQTDRAKRIVAGLLNFARQNQVVPTAVDVRDLVKRALTAVLVPETVRVETIHQGDGTSAELDRDQVTQVLVNLISNACDAMPAGGEVKIATHTDSENVRFVVSDTGTGILPEHRTRVFTPFFTTKPAGQGTGLGLAVTYGIVKMHRGDISLRSNADPAAGPTGTTFTVTVPRRRAAEKEKEESR